MRYAFVLALAAAALASPAFAEQGGRAEAVHRTHCSACHSPSPEAPMGDLTRRAPDAYERFARIVREGDTPSGKMPAFPADAISESDLRALHAFIRRLRARG